MFDFLAVFWEAVICIFMRTIDDVESMLFGSVCLVVTDIGTIPLFEIVPYKLWTKGRIRTEFQKDFMGNKLFSHSRLLCPEWLMP